MSGNHGNEQNKKPNLLFVICYLSSRSGVVCDLLNPRPMWPRTLYFALLFLAFHGLSIADELNAFTPPTLDHPLKVKVVVVAMFEVGADTGDVPGEFQFWVERHKLDHVISLRFYSARQDKAVRAATQRIDWRSLHIEFRSRALGLRAYQVYPIGRHGNGGHRHDAGID